LNDAQLVAAVLAGQATAERELYDRHVDRVYRLAYRMAGDETLARDFTQDTFVRAFGKLADFRGEASLATWLHTIATSVILNGLKKVRRIRSREIGGDELPDVPVTRRDAEPDLKLKLARAIDALPDGYRMVFVYARRRRVHARRDRIGARHPVGHIEGAAVPGEGPAAE
jgi:RNA polymerase sigma-70 factor, ECF subfamily